MSSKKCKKTKTLKNFLIFREMELFIPKNFLIFQKRPCKGLKNEQKMSSLKKFLVFYEVFTIFTAKKAWTKIQHRDIHYNCIFKNNSIKIAFYLLLRTMEDIRGAADCLYFPPRWLTSNILREQVSIIVQQIGQSPKFDLFKL